MINTEAANHLDFSYLSESPFQEDNRLLQGMSEVILGERVEPLESLWGGGIIGIHPPSKVTQCLSLAPKDLSISGRGECDVDELREETPEGKPKSPRFTNNDKEASGALVGEIASTTAQNAETLRAALLSARNMAFDYRAITPEAAALGDYFVERVEAWESCHRRRRRKRRSNDRARFHLTIRRFVADLVINGRKDSASWGYFLVSPNLFSGVEVSYRAVMAAREALEALGYLEARIGFSTEGFQGRQQGCATRFRGTKAFFEVSASLGVVAPHALSHYLRSLPRRPLVLKSAPTRDGYGNKLGGRQIRFAHDGVSLALERDLLELNEFLDSFELGNGLHRRYRRIFNMGDQPGFIWNKGGRLYSQGEDSYQRLNSNNRLKMTIDGEPVCEIDIRGSYLTILYARLGSPLPEGDDPYEIEGLPRAVVKAWVTMTIGHDKFHKRWPKTLKDDLRGKGIDLSMYPVKNVQEAVISRHPMLKSWHASGLTWADLMYLESEAVVNASLRLMYDHGVPCFSVHDSIIVPKGESMLASEVLATEYEKVTGAVPTLKMKTRRV